LLFTLAKCIAKTTYVLLLTWKLNDDEQKEEWWMTKLFICIADLGPFSMLIQAIRLVKGSRSGMKKS
jgi:hypothetical protein